MTKTIRKWMPAALCALASAAAHASVDPSPRQARMQAHESAAGAYERALLYSRGDSLVQKDRARMLVWLRRAAALGHGEAQYRLAAVYSRGAYGVARNEALATTWLERAARMGFAEAQYALGLRYAEGKGVARDVLKALAWIAKAAKNGHPAAIEAMQRARAAPLPTR